jgi:hypothetical protein
MKKIAALFFMVFVFSGVSFAADEREDYLKGKIGYDFAGVILGSVVLNENFETDNYIASVNNGVSFSLEYVVKVPDSRLRGGAGLEFNALRKDKSIYGRDMAFMPLYVTFEWYPFKEYFFTKMNIGYNLMWYDSEKKSYEFQKSSVYASLIAGFDIAKGIFMDISYSFYCSKASNFFLPDIAYFKAAVSIGYKFRV